MFVQRNEDGVIVAASWKATAEIGEAIEDGDPELSRFLSGPGPVGMTPLEQSDLEVVRVLEDLIEVLMEKGVIRFTDLPEPAQRKLLARKTLRQSAGGLQLLQEGEETF